MVIFIHRIPTMTFDHNKLIESVYLMIHEWMIIPSLV